LFSTTLASFSFIKNWGIGLKVRHAAVHTYTAFNGGPVWLVYGVPSVRNAVSFVSFNSNYEHSASL
jgi:hypothetical protein